MPETAPPKKSKKGSPASPPAPPAPAPQLPQSLPVVPPRKGAGKPPKARAPKSMEEVALMTTIKEAGVRRDAARLVYARSKTAAAELLVFQTSMEVALGWSAYLQATNNHTHAIKWADQASKDARSIAQIRELIAVDLLQELAERSRKESAVLGRVGR